MSRPGLYIHIPYCKTKCRYCAFYSITDFSRVDDFFDALRREMALLSGRWQNTFDTLYIGGGTPSALPPSLLERTIAEVRNAFLIDRNAEITIEANPADITDQFLKMVTRAGVNRLSIGVQSFYDPILRFLGRRHRGGQAFQSVERAKRSGLVNISVDLIYGIHGQSLDTWEETLRQAVLLRPCHLSCYQLTIEKGTLLHRQTAEGKIAIPDENIQAEFFFHTSMFLKNEGYLHYEVSSFALPGWESRHNSKYWDHTPYLGLGPSAHSFRGILRSRNVSSVDSYIAALFANRLPVEEKEALTEENLRLETLFLGFRRSTGISLADYNNRFGKDLLEEKKNAIDNLIKAGFLEIKDGFLRPTVQGMAVADSLALI